MNWTWRASSLERQFNESRSAAPLFLQLRLPVLHDCELLRSALADRHRNQKVLPVAARVAGAWADLGRRAFCNVSRSACSRGTLRLQALPRCTIFQLAPLRSPRARGTGLWFRRQMPALPTWAMQPARAGLAFRMSTTTSTADPTQTSIISRTLG